MQNKINEIAIAEIPLKISQNPWNFRFKGAFLSLFPQDSPIFWGIPKKKFLFNFNAAFNIVKINSSSKFLHGTPYSTANFSPREFQANRSVTVKVLSLSARLMWWWSLGVTFYLFCSFFVSFFRLGLVFAETFYVSLERWIYISCKIFKYFFDLSLGNNLGVL